MHTIRRSAGWLWLALLSLRPAAALLPPLEDYSWGDDELRVTIQVPRDWQTTPLPDGVRMRRDSINELSGAVALQFLNLTEPREPEAVLQQALDAWSDEFGAWRVTSVSTPPDRPRVRVAELKARRLGFPVTGYAMAVVGRETATVGFGYAEPVSAKRLELPTLVELLVAGSQASFPVRGKGDDSADQAVEQTVQRLYGDGAKDFQSYLKDLADQNELKDELLSECATFQPELRRLGDSLLNSLPKRAEDRCRELKIYCVPSREFNAFTAGRNDEGPGFLVFDAGLTDVFAALSQEYAALRERQLSPEQVGTALTAYSTKLAEAVLRESELPRPEPINFADESQTRRFVKVFHSIIGVIMAHEMAHYYLRHSESGETGDPFSVQQREVAADTAAIGHLQAAADAGLDVWEGGAIHAFGFLATLDNVATALGGQERQVEWTRTHPFGQTRLDMARASLGSDNFHFRNDPWNGGSELEHGPGGIRVVGGLESGGGETAVAFTHPVSGVVFQFPTGWRAELDPDDEVLTIRRVGREQGLPLMLYTCGGEYKSAKAIAKDIYHQLGKDGAGLTLQENRAVDLGDPQAKAHVITVEGRVEKSPMRLCIVGVLREGAAHGFLLMSSLADAETDQADFDDLFRNLTFPGARRPGTD